MVSVPKGEAGETRSWLPDQDRKSVAEEKIEILDPTEEPAVSESS